MMHEIAVHTINFERTLHQDVYDNPFATDLDLMRKFESIPSNVPDAEIEAWLIENKTRNLQDYKNNISIWKTTFFKY